MKEDFERGRALIAWIGTGNRHAQRIERGICARRVGHRADVNSNFLHRPARLVNVRQTMRQTNTLLAYQRRHSFYPRAVGPVIRGPAMGAVDWRGAFQDLCQVRGQSRVAGLFLRAGKFIASFKIAQLVLQQQQFGIKQQIFVGIVRGIVGNRVLPCVLFRTAQNDFRVRRDLQSGFAGLPGLWRAHRLGVAPLPGFFVQPMMKVDPESAMQLEHRKRSIRDIHLWSSRNRGPKQQVYSEEQYWQARGNDASHGEVPDGIAKRNRAQITNSKKYKSACITWTTYT